MQLRSLSTLYPRFPVNTAERVKDAPNGTTYSSAPSNVMSSVGYWSISPRVNPEEMISSFDWKPWRKSDLQRWNIVEEVRTSWKENPAFVQLPLPVNSFHHIGHGRPRSYTDELRRKCNNQEWKLLTFVLPCVPVIGIHPRLWTQRAV